MRISRNFEGNQTSRPSKARERTCLITIQDEIGPGLVLWHPKGSLIRLLIENFCEQHQRRLRLGLFASRRQAGSVETSGHVDYYQTKTCSASMKLEGSEYQLADELPFPHRDLQVSICGATETLPIRYGGWAPSIVMNELACCTVCCASVALPG